MTKPDNATAAEWAQFEEDHLGVTRDDLIDLDVVPDDDLRFGVPLPDDDKDR